MTANDEVTFIDEADVYVCDNCGAFAAKAEDIKHHKTCTSGECKKWIKFYNDNER